MSRQVTWLHLSDLHMSPKTEDDARPVRVSLLDDLRALRDGPDRLIPDPDFFTGDAAFGHLGDQEGHSIEDQFARAHDFFEEVRKAYEPEVPRDRFFLIPGNHDVDRRA